MTRDNFLNLLGSRCLRALPTAVKVHLFCSVRVSCRAAEKLRENVVRRAIYLLGTFPHSSLVQPLLLPKRGDWFFPPHMDYGRDKQCFQPRCVFESPLFGTAETPKRDRNVGRSFFSCTVMARWWGGVVWFPWLVPGCWTALLNFWEKFRDDRKHNKTDKKYRLEPTGRAMADFPTCSTNGGQRMCLERNLDCMAGKSMRDRAFLLPFQWESKQDNQSSFVEHVGRFVVARIHRFNSKHTNTKHVLLFIRAFFRSLKANATPTFSDFRINQSINQPIIFLSKPPTRLFDLCDEWQRQPPPDACAVGGDEFLLLIHSTNRKDVCGGWTMSSKFTSSFFSKSQRFDWRGKRTTKFIPRWWSFLSV